MTEQNEQVICPHSDCHRCQTEGKRRHDILHAHRDACDIPCFGGVVCVPLSQAKKEPCKHCGRPHEHWNHSAANSSPHPFEPVSPAVSGGGEAPKNPHREIMLSTHSDLDEAWEAGCRCGWNEGYAACAETLEAARPIPSREKIEKLGEDNFHGIADGIIKILPPLYNHDFIKNREECDGNWHRFAEGLIKDYQYKIIYRILHEGLIQDILALMEGK